MLISRKMTNDKRVVTDFGHLNMHITKNNLAYPLLKDTFALIGSSKCEVMSVLDLRHLLFPETDRKLKEILWNSSLLWKCFLLVPKKAYGFEYFPSNLAVIH